MNKAKKNVSTDKIVRILKRLSPWIVICFIPYCLNMGGVITWRNENSFKGHINNLLDIITTALDNNEVLNGIKLALGEFIFNFTSIGAWSKFIIFLAISIALLKVVIKIIPHTPAVIKAVLSAGRTIIHFIREIKKRLTEKRNLLESIEYSLRYHLIPDYSNHSSVICLSTVINGMKFLGGVRADNVKFPKIHLISTTGAETDRLLDNPILIIQTSSGVFLCGHGLIDENGTVQRKLKLSYEIQSVTIGTDTYEIYIKER